MNRLRSVVHRTVNLGANGTFVAYLGIADAFVGPILRFRPLIDAENEISLPEVPSMPSSR